MNMKPAIGKIAAVVIGMASMWWPFPSFASQPYMSWMGALALSPDGQTVAAFSAGFELQVRIWNVRGGYSYPSVQDIRASDLAFTPDGRFLQVTTETETCSWEVVTGKRQANPAGESALSKPTKLEPGWQPSARIVSSAGYKDPHELQVMNSGKLVWKVQHTPWDATLAFSPDRERLVYVGAIPIPNELPGTVRKDIVLQIFDARTGGVLQSVPVGQEPALLARFTNDGKLISVIFPKGRVSLFDATTGRETKTFVIPPRPRAPEYEMKSSGSFRFCADGETLVVLRNDLELWNVRQGTLLSTLKAPRTLWPESVVLSADRKTFAVGESVQLRGNWRSGYWPSSPSVYVWDVESGQLLGQFG